MEILSLIIDSKDKKPIKNLLKMFYQVMDIPIKIVNNYGEKIYEIEWRKKRGNPCGIIEQNPVASRECQEYFKSSCHEAMRWGDTYISQCHLGFTQLCAPILYNDELIGGFIGCPFLMRNPSDQLLKNLMKNFNTSNELKKQFLTAVKTVSIIPEKRVKLAAELLFSLADFFSIPDLSSLYIRRQLNREQAQVAEEIQRYKRNVNSAEHHLIPILNLKKEKELIANVRLGDKIGAKTILNEFLGQVMLHNPINIELLKAYVLELSTILTRAAVEEGANPENILGLKYQFVSELSDISDHETLCFWVVKVMESICDNIYRTRNNHHFRILEQACNYIKENYTYKLTLESVSKEIYISPFYLCHLFKEDLNTTFGEFVTKTRIDAAKTLLRETDLSLAQIALEVGYPDQSYFTKVFKKVEQITPKTYRRLSSAVL